MTRYLSPLRYPGGKSQLAGFVASLIAAQPTKPTIYVEPYAGGAGVALDLLFNERVESIVLNDIDPAIAAFWRSVFFHTNELTSRVLHTHPSMREWRRQYGIYTRGSDDDLELGFAAFFLNRTNHSGILIDARPIGGLRQDGAWKIDARYNARELSERITRLGRYGSRVTVLERDGRTVAREYVGKAKHFVYLDPPYVLKGPHLYVDTLEWTDHRKLARLISSRPGWFLTYDVDPRIRSLYQGHRRAMFSMTHTAGPRHVGREYAIFSKELVIPSLSSLGTMARYLSRGTRLRIRAPCSSKVETPRDRRGL